MTATGGIVCTLPRLLRASVLPVIAAAAFAAALGVGAATLTVGNLNDSGAGSLRNVVASALSGDTIAFGALSGTITLTTAPITLATSITIAGPGANVLTISGNATQRLFVNSSNVTISGLTLQNGRAGITDLQGGAILNTGTLTLDHVALRANSAFDGGGAIANVSTAAGNGILTIRASELSGNSVTDPSGIGGGAILSRANPGGIGSVTLVNSTVAGNLANATPQGMVGGGIVVSNGELRVIASTIAGNSAGPAGGNIHQGAITGTTLTLGNSIVSDGVLGVASPAVSETDIFQPAGATINSQGYNIVRARSLASGYAPSDAANGTNPLLGALANNGGRTQTRAPGAGSPAFALVPAVACTDENAVPMTIDQRDVARLSPGAVTCDTGAVEQVRVSVTANVFSRKLHGAVPYALPIATGVAISGPVTVEPRAIGAGHTLVFQFASAVTNPGIVQVRNAANQAVGSVSAPVITGAASNEVSVTLTNIPDAQRLTVSLFGVNGNLNTSVSLGYLLGDVNNSRSTSSADITALKVRAGQSVTSGNFFYDLNATGVVSAADIAAVKAVGSRGLP
jgi:hypothetical protein